MGSRSNVASTGGTALSITSNANGKRIKGEALEAHQRITLPKDPLTGQVATQPQGVIRLRPSLVTLCIGANNSLGSLLHGDVTEDRIGCSGSVLIAGALTHPERFRFEYEVLLDHLAAIRDAYGTDFILIDVPNPSLAPCVVYRARRDESSPTKAVDDSGLTSVLTSYMKDDPNAGGYQVQWLPDGRSKDYSVGITPLGTKDSLFGSGSIVTQEIERARLMVNRGHGRKPLNDLGRPIQEVLHPDQAFYPNPADPRQTCLLGQPENRYLGLAYWGFLGEAALFKRDLRGVTEIAVPEKIWVTDRERDRLVSRVVVFNQDIGKLADARDFDNRIPIQQMFNFIDNGGLVVKPSWWSGNPVRCNRSELGGIFSGDLFHPLPTGYSVFGDRILYNLNLWIDGMTEPFGGFVQPVARLIPEGIPIGDRPVDRVADQDLILQHILKKWRRDQDHLQYRMDPSAAPAAPVGTPGSEGE